MSNITPKRSGPGMDPMARQATDCTASASDLCSSATALHNPAKTQYNCLYTLQLNQGTHIILQYLQILPIRKELSFPTEEEVVTFSHEEV